MSGSKTRNRRSVQCVHFQLNENVHAAIPASISLAPSLFFFVWGLELYYRRKRYFYIIKLWVDTSCFPAFEWEVNCYFSNVCPATSACLHHAITCTIESSHQLSCHQTWHLRIRMEVNSSFFFSIHFSVSAYCQNTFYFNHVADNLM